MRVEECFKEVTKVVEVFGFFHLGDVFLEEEFSFGGKVCIELLPSDLFSKLISFVGQVGAFMLGLDGEHLVRDFIYCLNE